MSYKDEYSETVEFSESDLSEAQRIIIEGFMRDGEFKTRDALIAMLEKDIDDYLYEVDNVPNMEWVEGVRYCIHIIKNARL